MLSLFIRLWIRLWRINDSLIDINAAQPQVVFAASYSATKAGLAHATRENMNEAIGIVKKVSPKAIIVFGSCSHPFPGAADLEEGLKIKMCQDAGVPYLSVGPITNSVTEMEAVRDFLKARHVYFETMIIVTCELHSPSEFCLADMIFPGKEVFVRSNSFEWEVQKDHPTKDQQTLWRWLPMSIARFCAFKAASWGAISLDRLRGIQHAGE